MNKHIRDTLILFVVSAVFIVGMTLLIQAKVFNKYTVHIMTTAGINIIVALSINLILGFTGQLALGHAGFMAIGAYTTAVVMMHTPIPLPLALVLGGLMAGLFGLLIGFPTLRLTGDYLAIVTLGFGEIIRVIMINIPNITGGAAGLKGVPGFTSMVRQNHIYGFVWVMVILVLVIALIHNLINSSHGRAIISIREDEIASNSMGVNVFYTKMFSFVLSAFIAGMAGGLFAPLNRYLNPSSFGYQKSVDFIIIVVLGGMGSVTGTVLTGFVLTYLQEALRFLKDFRLVIYPLLLIIMMLFRPKGIMGSSEWSITGLFDKIVSKFKSKEVHE
ncbi:branched-chain amino acid ABC transporter permease [Spirochaeta cellobiosiphila]|uniref:branched-chain amino acid ABC transporter permease n=1 Tax=Spirochaeta cellobiosiphila TaxID=504483 RepID=UPI00041F3BAA|nr:branched-chain amino acid ABC transporter permease [Spirochaeta cellobiosiphila]